MPEEAQVDIFCGHEGKRARKQKLIHHLTDIALESIETNKLRIRPPKRTKWVSALESGFADEPELLRYN